MQQWTIRSGGEQGPQQVRDSNQQLGHSGPDTTYRPYTQIKGDTANDEANNLFSDEKLASIPNSTSCEDIQIG
jgi:hypothetical protein